MSELTLESQDKTIWLIGGPNGAGKSSLIRVLRETMPEIELLDADHFQKSYGTPQSASFKAGRELLHRVDESINQGASFIWESTLSGAGKAYLSPLKRALQSGYSLELHWIFLPTVQVGKARVRARVESGGHDISDKDQERRFPRVMHNLFQTYWPLADKGYLWTNSSEFKLAARKENGLLKVVDQTEWTRVKEVLEHVNPD